MQFQAMWMIVAGFAALPVLAQDLTTVSVDGAAHNLQATLALSKDSPDLKGVQAHWRLRPLGDVLQEDLPGDQFGEAFAVSAPAGSYQVQVRLGAASASLDTVLLADEVTRLRLILEAGMIVVVPKKIATDSTADQHINVELRGKGGTRDRGFGRARYFLPAGPVELKAQLGKAEVRETLSLAAGQEVEKELVLNAATVTGQARFAPESPVITTQAVNFAIQTEARVDQRGNLTSIYGSEPLVVSAGRYVLRARLGKVMAKSPVFDLQPGGDRRVDIILNAGRLQVVARQAYRLIVRHAADADGQIEPGGQDFASGRGPEYQEVLPAGKYVLSLVYDGGKEMQRPFVITAGQDTKLEISPP